MCDTNFIFFKPKKEFIYGGIVLQDDKQSLEQYGVRANSTIHVYQKRPQVEYTSEPATEEQIQKAVMNYRLVFLGLAGGSLAVILESKLITISGQNLYNDDNLFMFFPTESNSSGGVA